MKRSDPNYTKIQIFSLLPRWQMLISWKVIREILLTTVQINDLLSDKFSGYISKYEKSHMHKYVHHIKATISKGTRSNLNI